MSSQGRVTSGYVLVHCRLRARAACQGTQLRVQCDVIGPQLAQARVTPSPVSELPMHQQTCLNLPVLSPQLHTHTHTHTQGQIILGYFVCLNIGPDSAEVKRTNQSARLPQLLRQNFWHKISQQLHLWGELDPHGNLIGAPLSLWSRFR